MHSKQNIMGIVMASW